MCFAKSVGARLVFLFFLTSSLVASANVFGVDRRVAMVPGAYPARSIGIVQQVTADDQVAERCTGALVGKRLVLTAAHCVALAGNHLNPRIATVFLPDIPERVPPLHQPVHAAVDVWAGDWRKETDSRSGDWAILLLDRSPVEDTIGDAQPLPFSEEPPVQGQSIALMGYSIDWNHGQTLSADLDCHIRMILRDGVFHHDCALFAGASGGPIVTAVGKGAQRQWEVIGVQTAHKSGGTSGLQLATYEPRFANLGTSVLTFMSLLRKLRTRYETRPDRPSNWTSVASLTTVTTNADQTLARNTGIK